MARRIFDENPIFITVSLCWRIFCIYSWTERRNTCAIFCQNIILINIYACVHLKYVCMAREINEKLFANKNTIKIYKFDEYWFASILKTNQIYALGNKLIIQVCLYLQYLNFQSKCFDCINLQRILNKWYLFPALFLKQNFIYQQVSRNRKVIWMSFGRFHHSSIWLLVASSPDKHLSVKYLYLYAIRKDNQWNSLFE